MKFVDKMREIAKQSTDTANTKEQDRKRQCLEHVSNQIFEIDSNLESEIEKDARGQSKDPFAQSTGRPLGLLLYMLTAPDGTLLDPSVFGNVRISDVEKTAGFSKLMAHAAELGVRVRLSDEAADSDECDEEIHHHITITIDGWRTW